MPKPRRSARGSFRCGRDSSGHRNAPRCDVVADSGMLLRMDRERFRALVAQALDEIPEPFLSRLENVEVIVEDEPDDDLLEDMGLDPNRDTLFGLYDGIPLDERGDADPMMLPDRITLFYRPLVRAFRTPARLRREIRKTIIHEVGHFFGFDDGDLEREGY